MTLLTHTIIFITSQLTSFTHSCSTCSRISRSLFPLRKKLFYLVICLFKNKKNISQISDIVAVRNIYATNLIFFFFFEFTYFFWITIFYNIQSKAIRMRRLVRYQGISCDGCCVYVVLFEFKQNPNSYSVALSTCLRKIQGSLPSIP